jgi:hypothetical protein
MNKSSYYKVGKVEFDSKVMACVFAQKVNKPVEWVYDAKAVFDKYDWTVEPMFSLDFYYDKRAREIREKYDYVVITYSGGADSHNMLLSFMRQGLRVDEILVSHISELSDKRAESLADSQDPTNIVSEHKLNVIPKLRELRIQLPETKFSVIDMSDRVLDFVSSKSEEDWIYQHKDVSPIWNVTRDWFHISDFKKTLDTGKRVAIVMGSDKPRISIKDGNVYTAFADTGLLIGTPDSFEHDYTNTTTEYFYWDKTAVDMLCKQAHMVKREIELNPQLQKLWDMKIIGENYGDVYRTYHERLMVPWIYTTWDNGFQAVKSKGGAWDSEYDSRWWKQSVDSTHVEIVNRGLSYLEQNARDYILYKDGIPQRLRPFVIQYNVGKFNGSIAQR